MTTAVNPPVVLAEKLRRPEVTGLGRARLERPLLDSTSRLALVVAPPGSGKTTLLAHVAAATQAPVAWYRTTPDDVTEAALVAHLSRAMRGAIGIRVVDSAMTVLLESLERLPEPTTVILDDLHEIIGSAAERALERFVTLRPQSVRLLVGSRRQPEMNLPRMQVSGVLQEISSDDLRFRSWEVEELFNSIFHEPLSPEAAAALTRRTGGWAAGLQLFHLATSGRSASDRQRALVDLGGRSKLVRSYLARNVLDGLPEQRRQFLLRTCTLGVMTGSLCDALLETTGSAAILDELEQQQLFTSSDDDGTTFRYHEVLRAHLEWALVQEYGEVGAQEWYSKSAALLESTGDRSGAVRAFAQAEDWGAVARLIRAHEPVSGPGFATDLLLPSAVVRHDPWLMLADARRRVRDGSLAVAAETFRRAEALLDEPGFRDICRRERAVAIMWGPVAATGSALPGDRPEQHHWSARLREALRRAPSVPVVTIDTDTDGRTHPVVSDDAAGGLLGLGLTALVGGDTRQARGVLEAVRTGSRAEATSRLLAELACTMIDLMTGDCRDPSASLGQIALDADLAGLPWAARLARGLYESVLVALGSPAWRLTACADLIDECERAGDDWGAAILEFAAAVGARIANPDPADDGGFTGAATRFRRLDAPILARWTESMCIWFHTHAAGTNVLGFTETVTTSDQAIRMPGAAKFGAAADVDHDVDHNGIPELAMLIRPLMDLSRTPTDTSTAAPTFPSGTGNRPPPKTVHIRCFGGFAVVVDGVVVDLGPLRPRARALLRLLALTPDQGVHREHLVEALWPGVALSIGNRRLQVAVSSVRQLLEHAGLCGPSGLSRHGEAYRLTLPAGSTVDVRSFEQWLREAARCASRGDTTAGVAAREAALTLYSGELLPEDGSAEHIVSERERLRLAAASAAATQARDNRALGRTVDALEAARLSVKLDRFQDLAWELIIELHEASGDTTAAARARIEHARVLAELEKSSMT